MKTTTTTRAEMTSDVWNLLPRISDPIFRCVPDNIGSEFLRLHRFKYSLVKVIYDYYATIRVTPIFMTEEERHTRAEIFQNTSVTN